MKVAIPLNKEPNTINSFGGASGVMVIVVGNGHGDSSSNPWLGCVHFT